MDKILNIDQAIKISKKLRAAGKTIVLAGGSFDILHVGHIEFLQQAKNQGDYLFVLLESDETVKTIKGEYRPINTQEDRAKILSSLHMIDYVLLLPRFKNDNDYDNLVSEIKPAIIATTVGDPGRKHKERQAALVKANLVDVIERIPEKSTSRLAKLIFEKFNL
ncbi:MAG: adenylyltransferase/cytidyltransferase family protein [Candidatus Levybacteria bacterium]|nr:adenylyltransferase/cytidyltransferase family protein [Candidatus Levybacteria bacterium]